MHYFSLTRPIGTISILLNFIFTTDFSAVTYPVQNFEGGKSFGIKGSNVLCLGHRLSKRKTTRFAWNFCGAWPLALACMSVDLRFRYIISIEHEITSAVNASWTPPKTVFSIIVWNACFKDTLNHLNNNKHTKSFQFYLFCFRWVSLTDVTWCGLWT